MTISYHPRTLHINYLSRKGGGYSSLLAPQRRFSYSGGGRRSNSESSRVLSAYPMGGSFGIDDNFLETDGDEADDEFDQLTTSVDVEKSHCLYVPTKVSMQELLITKRFLVAVGHR